MKPYRSTRLLGREPVRPNLRVLRPEPEPLGEPPNGAGWVVIVVGAGALVLWAASMLWGF